MFIKQAIMVLNVFNNTSQLTKEEKEIIKERFRTIRRPELLERQKIIYFNAWSRDSDSDPLNSILYVLLNNLSFKKKNTSRKVRKKFKTLIKAIAKIVKNINIDDFSDYIDKQFKTVNENLDLEIYIKELVEGLVGESNRLIFFIDELDRCNPKYAVKLLERLKHYFSLEKVTFVFSTNLIDLSNTVSGLYGSSFDGDRYLERFFDLKVSIPKINLYYYADYALDTPKAAYKIMDYAAIDFFELTPREANRFLTDVEKIWNLSEKEGSKLNKNEQGICSIMIPFMIGVKTTDFKQYEQLLIGKSVQLLVEYLTDPNVKSQIDDIDINPLMVQNAPIGKNWNDISPEELANLLSGHLFHEKEAMLLPTYPWYKLQVYFKKIVREIA